MLIPDPHNILIPKLKSMEDMFDFSNFKGSSEFEKSLLYSMYISHPGRFKFVAVNIIVLIYLTSKNYSYITKDDVEACERSPVGTNVCSSIPRSLSTLSSHKTYQDIVIQGSRNFDPRTVYTQLIRIKLVLCTIKLKEETHLLEYKPLASSRIQSALDTRGSR
jgi:hypothetical protein